MPRDLPEVIRNTYCCECMKTVHLVLVALDGRRWYVCAGNPKLGKVGCGHRVEIKDEPVT